MAWVVISRNGKEMIFKNKPVFNNTYNGYTAYETCPTCGYCIDTGIELPAGAIEKMLGEEVDCRNKPVEI